jgi:glucokinase
MIILAGDIGGTKTNLGLFERAGDGRLRVLDERSVATGASGTLEEMISGFVAGRYQVDAASFGVAGPVADGVCLGENLPWKEVRDTSIAAALGVRRVFLLNDLEATSYGVRFLGGDQLVTLQAGRRAERANIAVIAAGTGLGEGGLVWQTGSYHTLACEGGHTDLAVRNELEIELLRYLLKLERPVNQEAVLCGTGLTNVYDFLRATGRAKDSAAFLATFDAAKPSDKPGLISRAAAEGREPGCDAALDLFVTMYGARAGNLALTLMARGGVYVGGGIAPKNLAKMKAGAFMTAFLDKGDHFRPILQEFPVHVVLEQRTALLGAANYAADQGA